MLSLSLDFWCVIFCPERRARPSALGPGDNTTKHNDTSNQTSSINNNNNNNKEMLIIVVLTYVAPSVAALRTRARNHIALVISILFTESYITRYFIICIISMSNIDNFHIYDNCHINGIILYYILSVIDILVISITVIFTESYCTRYFIICIISMSSSINMLRPFFILIIVRPRIFESKFRNHCAKKLVGALRKPTSFM